MPWAWWSGTAVMGKAGENKGRPAGRAFRGRPVAAQIDGFFDASPIPSRPAPDLLRQCHHPHRLRPGPLRRTRQAHPKRPDAAGLRRHASARDACPRPLPPQGSKIQISFSYSDGFGREIQKKIQAEPGPVPVRDGEGKIVVGPDGQPQMTDHDVSPRWVGQRLDRLQQQGQAGPPVRAVFQRHATASSSTSRIGVSPVLFYDPVEPCGRHAAPQPHLGEGRL